MSVLLGTLAIVLYGVAIIAVMTGCTLLTDRARCALLGTPGRRRSAYAGAGIAVVLTLLFGSSIPATLAGALNAETGLTYQLIHGAAFLTLAWVTIYTIHSALTCVRVVIEEHRYRRIVELADPDPERTR